MRLPLQYSKPTAAAAAAAAAKRDALALAAKTPEAAVAAAVLQELQQQDLLHGGSAIAAAAAADTPQQQQQQQQQEQQQQDAEEEEEQQLDPWKQWSFLQQVVGVSVHLGVALQLTEDLPSELVLQRWLAEPLRCILIPTSIFLQLQQQQQEVTLLRQHLTFLLRCAELRVRLVLVDDREDETTATATTAATAAAAAAATAAAADATAGAAKQERSPPSSSSSNSNNSRVLATPTSSSSNSSSSKWCTYRELLPYIRCLQESFLLLPPLPPSLLFSRGHRNTLQIPMQPLADNLTACSYEVIPLNPKP